MAIDQHAAVLLALRHGQHPQRLDLAAATPQREVGCLAPLLVRLGMAGEREPAQERAARHWRFGGLAGLVLTLLVAIVFGLRRARP